MGYEAIAAAIAGAGKVAGTITGGLEDVKGARAGGVAGRAGYRKAIDDFRAESAKAAGVLSPYYDVGRTALPGVQEAGQYGSYMRSRLDPLLLQEAERGALDFDLSGVEMSPLTQFRLQEAREGILEDAAATGNLSSGATRELLNKARTQIVAEESEKLYDRMLNKFNQRLTLSQLGTQRLGTLAGMGQDAAGRLSDVYFRGGQVLSNLRTGQALSNVAAAQGVPQAYGGLYRDLGNVGVDLAKTFALSQQIPGESQGAFKVNNQARAK